MDRENDRTRFSGMWKKMGTSLISNKENDHARDSMGGVNDNTYLFVIIPILFPTSKSSLSHLTIGI